MKSVSDFCSCWKGVRLNLSWMSDHWENSTAMDFLTVFSILVASRCLGSNLLNNTPFLRLNLLIYTPHPFPRLSFHHRAAFHSFALADCSWKEAWMGKRRPRKETRNSGISFLPLLLGGVQLPDGILCLLLPLRAAFYLWPSVQRTAFPCCGPTSHSLFWLRLLHSWVCVTNTVEIFCLQLF